MPSQGGEQARGLLAGKTALVTGASQGIGAAIAECFAQNSCSLLLASRSAEKLNKVAQRCRKAGAPAAEVMCFDATDPASMDALGDGVLSRLGGPPSILVNGAGLSEGGGDLLTGDPAGWERTVDADLLGPLRLIRRLAPGMAERGEGCIINVGSLAGVQTMQRDIHYSAAKTGLRTWSLASYEALRASGVRTLVIEPGFVDTEMTKGVEGALRERMLRPQDVAEAALLPFRLTPAAAPVEVVLRLCRSAYPAK